MNHISEIDYTQPFGQRAPEELPMRFHRFLVVINCLAALLTLASMIPFFLATEAFSILATGAFSISLVLPQLTGLLITFIVQVIFTFALLFKRRWIITLYQWVFWLQIGFGIFAMVVFCFIGSVAGTVLSAGAGAFIGVLVALLVGGVSIGLNLFITHCILKYYRRREHLLT